VKKIRVMIVEDSDVAREYLRHIISADSRFEVVAAVPSAEEALRRLSRDHPDVISMDIRLPGMNGFEATCRIMAERPTPIVVVSASVESEDLKISMNALRAGALAIVEKPAGMGHEDYAAMAGNLCGQLAIMSDVRLVKQRIDRNLDFVPAAKPPATGGRTGIARDSSAARPTVASYGLLAIVCSTGGPSALARLLGDLPEPFPLPILLVQHISPAFLEGFVSWLSSACPFTAKIAREGEIPSPGKIYVAPAERHLEMNARALTLGAGECVSGQRPSGSVLFQSLARHQATVSIGVLLTGMGEDGADGLLALKRAGGYTIAEDETTAVVYGMPAAAMKRGAVCESLPLHEIARRIRELAAVPPATVRQP